jgi:hypothetical protein
MALWKLSVDLVAFRRYLRDGGKERDEVNSKSAVPRGTSPHFRISYIFWKKGGYNFYRFFLYTQPFLFTTRCTSARQRRVTNEPRLRPVALDAAEAP